MDNDGTAEYWITASEAAKIIGCHKLTVYRYARSGELRRKKDVGQTFSTFWKSDAESLRINKAALIAVKKADKQTATAESKAKSLPAPKTHNQSNGTKRIEAICPRCKRKHMITKVWIGRGVPRFFCERCRHIEAYQMGSDWQNAAVV